LGFNYLTNTDLDTAREDYISALIGNGMKPQLETISVPEASGRITALPVYASTCSPHYNACAMDGIAIEAKLTFGASETTPAALKPDQYKHVDTGDLLPDGCDAVVMIEDVIKLGDDGTIKLYEAVAPWQHIRQIGEDICAGEMILPSYSKITPAALGAMIAGGITEIAVVKKPVVGIIPTGDEIVPSTSKPGEGEIPEFNSTIFTAMLHQWGAEAITYPIVNDNAGLIRNALEIALSQCDMVLLCAGSSAGREDHSASVIAETGTVLHHGIAIKPGKPTILGYSGEKPVIGLPGYPVSGIIVMNQLVQPIIEFLCCAKNETTKQVEAVLSKSVVSTLKYREFVRVRMGYVKERLIASPLSRGSGVVTSFMRADGILEIPKETEGYESGANVIINLLRPAEDLKNSIVVIGSHDPLLDELSDLLRIKNKHISIGSAHVGSMSGILAIKKGEAHIAGTHLLDEETGEYNTTFVKRLISDGGVRLVERVKRKQGFIIQKGNPKNITAVTDLVRDGIRYINRQKGSGTRVLIDYLCKNAETDTSKINGYDREEYTHTSVAALIAANSADAGLGVYSVAKMYDLDFIPVCDEQYDLLIPDHAWELPVVQELIKVLKSSDFKLRLEKLGGYATENPGEVRKVFKSGM